MTNTDPIIPVAIVGLGRAGWHLHFQPLLKLSGFKIVAVADPAADRCREAAELTGCREFASIDDLLKETEATLVVIATPSSFHYRDAAKVLESGRHCLVEKPIALSAREASQLLALAERKNVRLFVNHTHLHRDEFHHLQEVVKSGILGPIFSVRAFWGHYARRWDWQTLRKNGGGQLNNTCPHTLSVVLPLLGARVESVFADLRNIKDAGDAEDHVHIVMKAENGTTADVVVSSAIAATLPKWILCGKNGTLTCDGTKSRLRYYDPTKAEALSVLDTAAPDRQYLRETLPWEEKEIEVTATPVKPLHENVYDVLTGRAEPVVSPESAAEVVRVTEMAYLAAGYAPVVTEPVEA